MRRLSFVILLFLLFCQNVQAVSEFSAEYGYSKKIFGDNKQSDVISKSYSGSFAVYFLSLTAVEFNYFHSKEIITQRNDILTPDNWTLTEDRSEMVTNIYGVGLRQSLAPMKSRIRPTISLGYARQFEETGNYLTFKRESTGDIVAGQNYEYKSRADSIFASFAIKILLTRRLSLKGSVKSIFRAFEFDEASDNLKYMAGLSWIF